MGEVRIRSIIIARSGKLTVGVIVSVHIFAKINDPHHTVLLRTMFLLRTSERPLRALEMLSDEGSDQIDGRLERSKRVDGMSELLDSGGPKRARSRDAYFAKVKCRDT